MEDYLTSELERRGGCDPNLTIEEITILVYADIKRIGEDEFDFTPGFAGNVSGGNAIDGLKEANASVVNERGFHKAVLYASAGNNINDAIMKQTGFERLLGRNLNNKYNALVYETLGIQKLREKANECRKEGKQALVMNENSKARLSNTNYPMYSVYFNLSNTMGNLQCTRKWAEEDMGCGWKVGKDDTLRRLKEARKKI